MITHLGVLTGEAWHEARRGRVGGSDLGAIIGHGYQARAELLAEKTGQATRPDTEAMRRGHYAEHYLRAWLDGEKGIVLDDDRAGTYHGDDWAVINPDGISTDGRLVEFKCHATRDGWGRAGTDQIPAKHLAQVTWGAGWLGLDRWVLAVHATKVTDRGPTFDDALYKGCVDLDFFHWLKREARVFWADLQQQLPTTDRTAA